MIIERVDETRLMIVLAREDMVEYDLSFSKLDWCDFHSRKVTVGSGQGKDGVYHPRKTHDD